MEKEIIAGSAKNTFLENLASGFVMPENPVELLLLREYGSVFIAKGGVTTPKTVVFSDEAEVSAFQSVLRIMIARIGLFDLELQAPAMDALLKCIDNAKSRNLSIMPRDSDSARRSYGETVDLWKSRVDPALIHWTGEGKIQKNDAERIRGLSPYEQVPEIFKLEAEGIFFAKDLSKSIIYSVAPPGTSQHLSMLAFDVKEHENAKVREVLAKHGWYQTVTSDLPHFTYLGVPESELPDLGLRRVTDNGRSFWIPAI